MEDLIQKLPEVYQDIIVGGQLVAKGKRDCKTRCDSILPLVKPHDVILDMGSAEGYFTKKIAMAYPDSLVVSFECNPPVAEVQRESLERDGVYNVVLCQHRLTLDDLRRWARAVECIDVVLALSILHHFPPEDVMEVCDILCSVASTVVTEVPGPHEHEACGGGAKTVAYDHTIGFTPLCDVESHLGDYIRSVRFSRGGVARIGLDAYMNVPHEGGRKFRVRQDGVGWLIGSDDWCRCAIQGVNLWNLLHFNIIWPPKKWFRHHVTAAYMGLVDKSDVRLWNCLVTSSGIRAIDYMYPYDYDDQAAYHVGDINRLEEEINARIT